MAQINETVTGAKARLLIIAPEMEDIDPVPILELKPQVAVRIAANIDPKSSTTQEIISQLAQRPNIEIRQYDRKNIWGISRESEETLVSAVSGLGDVAGIATIVDEHQKMFVPILEDCWLQGKKYLASEVSLKGAGAPLKAAKTPLKAVKAPQKAPEVPQKVAKAPVKTTEGPQKVVKAPQKAAMPQAKPPTKVFVKPSPSTGSEHQLNLLFDPVKKIIEKGNPQQITDALSSLKEKISQKFAYHIVLYEMDTSMRRLATQTSKMAQPEIIELLAKVENWQSRLEKTKSAE
jgi:hypothetical protein